MKVKDLFNKRKRGITLISLVVTIIVLIILASVSINLIIDTNLIQRVASAKEPNEIESIREKLELVKASMYVDNKGKSNIDLYFQNLDKEKIEPYVVTKIQKFTENIGVVEVDNKYSFLIKFENSIEIKYEGKIGEVERQGPVIEITITGLNQQENLPIALIAEVIADGKKATSGKWILNKESENIGTDESLYTGNILENRSINLEIQETGEHYLHILTTDVYGRTKETIKGPITVAAKYHSHSGSTSSGGGCYTKPVYHSHSGNSTSGGACYKATTTSCNYPCPATNENHASISEGHDVWWYCPTHGAIQAQKWKVFVEWGKPMTLNCNRSITTYVQNCGKTTSTVTSYKLGCEKTEGITIDSYTITY